MHKKVWWPKKYLHFSCLYALCMSVFLMSNWGLSTRRVSYLDRSQILLMKNRLTYFILGSRDHSRQHSRWNQGMPRARQAFCYQLFGLVKNIFERMPITRGTNPCTNGNKISRQYLGSMQSVILYLDTCQLGSGLSNAYFPFSLLKTTLH